MSAPSLYALTTMLAGLEGMAVDVAKFYGDSGLDALNLIASIAAILFVLGFMLDDAQAAASYRHGIEVGPDPWQGSTLEWFAPSPPRYTTSTWSPTSAAPSRWTTSARRSPPRDPVVPAGGEDRGTGAGGGRGRRRRCAGRAGDRGRGGRAESAPADRDEDDGPVA